MDQKIELKKVKYLESASEETPCFTADLYIDGKLTAHISNSGHGGCNNVRPANGLSYKDVEQYDNIDFEANIFGMVYDYADIKKYQTKGLVYRKKDDHSKLFTNKFPMPIGKLKKHPQYKHWLKKQLDNLEKDNYLVLNSNL